MKVRARVQISIPALFISGDILEEYAACADN